MGCLAPAGRISSSSPVFSTHSSRPNTAFLFARFRSVSRRTESESSPPLWFLPQTRLVAQFPPLAIGLLYVADAVVRCTVSSGWSCSGLFSQPWDVWKLQFGDGLKLTRPE